VRVPEQSDLHTPSLAPSQLASFGALFAFSHLVIPVGPIQGTSRINFQAHEGTARLCGVTAGFRSAGDFASCQYIGGQMRMALPFSHEKAIETPANPARSPWSLATYRREIPRKPGDTRLISKTFPHPIRPAAKPTFSHSYSSSFLDQNKKPQAPAVPAARPRMFRPRDRNGK
jgi:hypothetical protein